MCCESEPFYVFREINIIAASVYLLKLFLPHTTEAKLNVMLQ